MRKGNFMARIKQKKFKVKFNRLIKKWQFWSFCVVISSLLMTWAGGAIAQSASTGGTTGKFNEVGTIWLLVAASLVFFMNAGFAMLETGFCRTSNAINVLAKNLIVFCVSTVAFWIFGFRFMFGDSDSLVFGQLGFFLDLPFPTTTDSNPFPKNGFENLKISNPESPLFTGYFDRSFAAYFFFQLAFAGTAATIVSGAVAERIKFWAFILFSFFLVGFIYPLIGHWIWGLGFLYRPPINFRDFAGSTVVHTVGGTAALVGAWLLNPRKGKFGYDPEDGSFSSIEDPNNFKPYNLSLAVIGCFILWLGWFGFNGGSTAKLEYVPHIMSTTLFGAATGGVSATLFGAALTAKKVSLSSIINGILGGLVGITASSAYVDIGSAGIIGAVSGIIVLLGDHFLRFCKIDDPVGAVPVHLFCGGWGTIAVGIFSSRLSLEYNFPDSVTTYNRATQIFYQFLGWFVVVFVVALLSVIFWILIGICLHLLEKGQKISEGEDSTIGINDDTDLDLGLLGNIINLIKIGARSIRVSVEEEEQGSDQTIIP